MTIPSIPAPNASMDQKSHVTHHFNYLEQTNTLMVLTMSHGADAGASGIT